MLDPRGGPTTGAPNWSSGYMPAVHQGTVLRTTGEPILNLKPPSGTSRDMQRREIDFINQINAGHQRARPGYSELAARIASYELAFRLQATAPDALRKTRAPSRPTASTNRNPTWHSLAQGPAPFGRQCLIARRLSNAVFASCRFILAAVARADKTRGTAITASRRT
jgi:hypothetical protein